MASDGNIPQHLWNGLAQNVELEWDQVSRFNSHFIGDTGGKKHKTVKSRESSL